MVTTSPHQRAFSSARVQATATLTLPKKFSSLTISSPSWLTGYKRGKVGYFYNLNYSYLFSVCILFWTKSVWDAWMKWDVFLRSGDNLLHNLEGKGVCDSLFFFYSVLFSMSQEYVNKLFCVGYFLAELVQREWNKLVWTMKHHSCHVVVSSVIFLFSI